MQGKKTQKLNWKIAQLKAHKTKTFKVLLHAVKIGYHFARVLLVLEDNKIKVVYEKKIRIQIIGVGSTGPGTYDTNDPVGVGQKTTYVFTARNEGTSECTKIWVINHIPQQMEFVSATGPTEYWYDSKKKTVIFAPLATMLPGQKLVYKTTCKAIEAGNAKNIVKMYHDQFSGTIVDEEGTSIYK